VGFHVRCSQRSGMMLGKLIRCVVAALCCLPVVAIAAGDDPKAIERLLAKVQSEPLIFVVARGEPNAFISRSSAMPNGLVTRQQHDAGFIGALRWGHGAPLTRTPPALAAGLRSPLGPTTTKGPTEPTQVMNEALLRCPKSANRWREHAE
jgi:hypothetical protein